ncbi:MAG: hypothetical protein ACPGJI_05480 [Kangiellaceae bacterium]
MNTTLQVPMPDNDYQTAQIQRSLQDLNKEIGTITHSIKSLSEGLRENSKTVRERAGDMQSSIDNITRQVDDLNLKVKYWKFGLCFMLACGGILASVVSFGNESITLMKNIFTIKK